MKSAAKRFIFCVAGILFLILIFKSIVTMEVTTYQKIHLFIKENSILNEGLTEPGDVISLTGFDELINKNTEIERSAYKEFLEDNTLSESEKKAVVIIFHHTNKRDYIAFIAESLTSFENGQMSEELLFMIIFPGNYSDDIVQINRDDIEPFIERLRKYEFLKRVVE